MKNLRACRKCGRITTELKCPDPNCNGDTTEDWDGYVYVLNPEHSTISKIFNKNKEGEYAIKTR